MGLGLESGFYAMRLYGFSGTRIKGTPRQAGWRATPPYDQIDDDLRDRLHIDPTSFAHLIRPAGKAGKEHEAAARLHDDWLRTGVVEQDRQPAVYPYVIELADGGRRLGLCGLIGLEDEDSGQIRPHEQTVEKTVEERLALLRATQVDFEPILLLSDDGGKLDAMLAADTAQKSMLADHLDLDGHRHMLYRIDDRDRIDGYRELLCDLPAIIADGHHRYTVAGRYAAESTPDLDAPAACKLSVVTSLSSPGMRIDPIHRCLRTMPDLETVTGLAFRRQGLRVENGEQLATAVARAQQPAVGLLTRQSAAVWTFDPAAPWDRPAAHLRHLAVGWLHDALLPGLGLDSSAGIDGTLVYRSDPNRLFAEIQDGAYDLGLWLPPMATNDFSAALESGQILPPKSTRFLPKLVSGLVWSTHDATLY